MDSLRREFGIQKLQTRGLDSVGAVKVCYNEKPSIPFYGGNFISAMSDTNATSEAIRTARSQSRFQPSPIGLT